MGEMADYQIEQGMMSEVLDPQPICPKCLNYVEFNLVKGEYYCHDCKKWIPMDEVKEG